ncbi:MAG: MATE family efflux transporter [Breznakibacter sp.]|nr:MATE family efflux transporter [Breznakibacter sp.]
MLFKTNTLVSNYKTHYSANFKLAFPVVLSQAGQMCVVMADTLMVGQLGEVPLAAVSLGGNLSVIALFLGIGIAYGITPLVGKSFGNQDHNHISYLLRQIRYVGWFTGFMLVSLMGLLYFLIPHMGQPQEVVQAVQPYFLTLMAALLPSQIFAVNKQFAEGLSNTRIAMMITITGNLINIFLNYIFIYGKFGCPAMGLLGAGYATLIAKIVMALLMDLSIRRVSLFKRYHLQAAQSNFSWQSLRKIVLQGLPIGGQMVIEVVAFSAGAIMMGWIGTTALAAHQIVMTLVSFTYMISSGLASATTIKISIFSGQQRFVDLRHSAWASIQMVVVFMLFNGVVFVLARRAIPSLFIHDQTVIDVAAQLLLVGGLFQLFDGVQVVALGVLRGMEDFVFPALVSGIAYILISLPIGYLFSIVLQAGPTGIWYGYLVGLAVAGILLVLRIKKHFRATTYRV